MSKSQNIVFSPASDPQSQFLTSDAFFTIYGGEHCASIEKPI